MNKNEPIIILAGNIREYEVYKNEYYRNDNTMYYHNPSQLMGRKISRAIIIGTFHERHNSAFLKKELRSRMSKDFEIIDLPNTSRSLDEYLKEKESSNE